jgi:HAD superfamily hydrolase (TIGR01662 family)
LRGNTPNEQGIIFDWDGTLVNTRRALLASYRYAYRSQLGVEFPKNDEQFRRVVAMRLRESAAIYAGDKATQVAAAYDAYYNKEGYTKIRMYPGIRATIETLRGCGYPVGVATNKGLVRMQKDAEFLNLQGLFDVVVTAEDTVQRKPHPAPLLNAVERLGLKPEGCSYVGDYPGDVVAAKAAGMTSIAALWGFYTEEELRAERPDRLLGSPRSLLEIYQ